MLDGAQRIYEGVGLSSCLHFHVETEAGYKSQHQNSQCMTGGGSLEQCHVSGYALTILISQ